eukprot:CAMPEP_0181077390 /NCGR_PEP_ID=MMETSP1071-20121207/926_1 /TAXON_ID=35127 /ORGANISM="Thalassiosira sp., Strain NH16" /LENGTH=372 /DNA_ID=CAMNT_0023158633 /DNA_START=139 /DNA_END=1257 /DNA_ORIENTATION=+
MASVESKDITGRRVLLRSCMLVAVPVLISWSFYTSNAHQNTVNEKDLLHAISGSIGSALSITLSYPLETVRTRLQVDASLTAHPSFLLVYKIGRHEGFGGLYRGLMSLVVAAHPSFLLVYKIGKHEGLRGLYRGWISLVVALMALNFVYFYCFHALRRGMMGHDIVGNGSLNKVLVDLIVGYLAGVVAVLVTGPLWLVNTRLKLQGVNIGQAGTGGGSKHNMKQQYTGIVHCLYKISNDEGILTLWHGTFTSIILALNPAIQLGVYEMLKRHHLIIGDADSGGSLEPFVNALLSKFIATVITYPIQVLQTRHRAGLKKVDTMQSSRNNEMWYSGILQLYRGLESKLLQTCLNSALMFVAYERLVGILTALIS